MKHMVPFSHKNNTMHSEITRSQNLQQIPQKCSKGN